MTYNEMLQKLYDLKGSGLELEKILTLLGEPQKKLQTVRIAGTNGKGSVAAFLAQILQEAGYRVGLSLRHIWSPRKSAFRSFVNRSLRKSFSENSSAFGQQ
ncbi:hypothetical protein LM604_01680 [Candidatus Acetothermia bacterium]|nr:hypothetical protein [Candidatus Acetothermia bacterium]